MEELQRFVNAPAEVSILDKEGQDQAPFVKKDIKKVVLCPDGTHVRIYFDHLHFFAVPLTSSVIQSENAWKAKDSESGLSYIIKTL